LKSWMQQVYSCFPVRIQDALLTLYSIRLDRQRYRGRFDEFRNLMDQGQWWDPDRMARWQDERLRTVVRHAYEHVPYYRRLFDHRGIDARRFRGREDLCRIPLLNREIVKSQAGDLRSRAPGHNKLAEGHTSGTTGAPLSVFYDSSMIAMNYAALDRQYRWAGANLGRGGDRIAVLRGNMIVPLRQKSPPFWRYNHFHNHILLSNFHLSPGNLEAYRAALRDYGPVVLDGYPSSIYVLAKLLLNRGMTVPLKAVLTSSETLYDFQREVIERAFACKVFDYFGAAERVIFSVECERHYGHHLCEEYGVTEVVDDGDQQVSSGVEGYLVGTTLHNLGFPLLRYRSSDRSAIWPQRCLCGRGLRLVSDVSTKAEDLIRLRDGRLISPSVLTHPFKPLDSIAASQLVQTAMDRMIVRIVPGSDFSAIVSNQLVRDLKSRLGENMHIEVELVDSLERTASGKFKWVVSQVETGL